jgi:hypothetical protein
MGKPSSLLKAHSNYVNSVASMGLYILVKSLQATVNFSYGLMYGFAVLNKVCRFLKFYHLIIKIVFKLVIIFPVVN